MLQALMLTPVVIQDRLLVKFCVVKSVKAGVLEYWSAGVLKNQKES